MQGGYREPSLETVATLLMNNLAVEQCGFLSKLHAFIYIKPGLPHFYTPAHVPENPLNLECLL